MTRYPKAIVWDLDGTLIDSAPDIADALNAVLAPIGCPALPVARVKTMIGGGVAKLIERVLVAEGRELAGQEKEDLLGRFLEIYSAGATERTRLYAYAGEVLEHFARCGVRHGLCTNKPSAVTHSILDGLEVTGFFGAVVGGDTTARKKPDPLPLETCLGRLGAGPGESVMIGDSAADLEAARALGMPVCLVTFGYSRDPVGSLGADALVDCLSALPEVVPGLWGVAPT